MMVLFDKLKPSVTSFCASLCLLFLLAGPLRAEKSGVFSIGRELSFSDMVQQAKPGKDTLMVLESPIVKKKNKKKPWISAVSSIVLPGAGQVYNGHWYKAPVIYAGGVVLYYFIDVNLKERRIYDKEIKARSVNDTASLSSSLAYYTNERLYDIRNYYQNNFELSIIIAGVVYLLNVVDAIVYAHLSTFNVSDNLSLRIEPYAQPAFHKQTNFPLDAGLKLTLTLK